VCDLVAGLGGQVVGCAFLVELSFLDGRARLDPYPVHAVLEYTS
jgi:adenine phosphoribosyltransferase